MTLRDAAQATPTPRTASRRLRALAPLIALWVALGGIAYADTAHAEVIAHWGMNEPVTHPIGSRVLQDESIYTHRGTIGRRVVLDGHSHHFLRAPRGVEQPGRIDRVPDSDDLDPGAQPFSISIRFLWAGGGDRNLIQKGQGSPAGGMVKVKTSVPKLGQPEGQVKCLFRGSTGDSQVESYGGRRLDDREWHRLICRRTATGTVMVLDGVKVDTNAHDPGVIANSWPVAIGGNTYCPPEEGLSCNYFRGRIADIVWRVG